MTVKNLLIGTMAFGIAASFGTAATGAEIVTQWTGNAGSPFNWNASGNWDNGVPNTNQYVAKFDQDATVTVNGNFTIGRLELVTPGSGSTDVVLSASSGQTLIIDADGDSNGKLLVPPSTTLEIGSNVTILLQDAVTHEIGGHVTIGTDTSVLRVESDVTFGPQSSTYGFVILDAERAKLEIARAASAMNVLTLTNRITVAGGGTVEAVGAGSGYAEFLNSRPNAADMATVLADNTSFPLSFNGNLILNDAEFGNGRPVFMADGNGAVLQLNNLNDGSDADLNPRLVSDFAADNCGMIEVLSSVYTEGTLLATFAGVISAPGAAVLRYDWVDATTYAEVATCYDPTFCGCP